MSVPSEEEFKEAIELINDFNGNEVQEEAENVPLDLEKVKEYYRKIFSQIHKKRKELYKTTAISWLHHDYGYRLGVSSLFGSSALDKADANWVSEGEEIAKDMAVKILEKYKYINSDSQLPYASFVLGSVSGSYMFADGYTEITNFQEYNANVNILFHQKLKRDAGTNVGLWLKNFLLSLRDYFFLESVEVNSTQTDKDRRILNLVNTLLSEISADDHRMFLLDRELEGFKRNLLWSIELAEARVRPVKQINATVKERLFLHSIWESLENIGLGSKISALCDFLTIEGIEHRLDRRTIERNVSKWRQEQNHFKKVEEKIEELASSGNPTTI